MKRFLACLLLLCVCSAANFAVTIAPDNSNIQYVGRWNFDNPSAPWVVWQGSSIIVNFKGTGIAIDIDAGTKTEEYRVVIDGVAEDKRREFSENRAKYTLASDLPDGVHKLELMKETFRGGRSYFYGLEVKGSGLVAPPARPSLRIEYFGDSNMNGSSNYSEKNEGAMGTYYAFPAMASRMLGAEMHNESVGGGTLDDNDDNDVCSYIFSQDYENQDPNYRSGFDPHIIVVNSGANDVGPGKRTIKKRFKNVIRDLRSVYGDKPHIVLFNAYGWGLNEPANYSQEVVKEVGGNLSALHYAWLWEQWHGCQWDYSGEAHMLVEHLASINPEWKQVKPNDIIDGFGRNWDFANGSFEHKAPFGGFGWRYYTNGVQRINDPANAVDGDYYIRLKAGQKVHQPTDATGDLLPGATKGEQKYYITASIRGVTPGAKAQIQTHFEGQEMYKHDKKPETFQTSTFKLTKNWKEYTHVATAGKGVWTLYNYLIAKSGTVEFDNVRMSNKPIISEK